MINSRLFIINFFILIYMDIFTIILLILILIALYLMIIDNVYNEHFKGSSRTRSSSKKSSPYDYQHYLQNQGNITDKSTSTTPSTPFNQMVTISTTKNDMLTTTGAGNRTTTTTTSGAHGTTTSTTNASGTTTTITSPSGTTTTLPSGAMSTALKPTTTTPTGATSAPTATQNSWLTANNNLRASAGQAPVTWNNTLATAAAKVASQCNMQHSGGSAGENIYSGGGDPSAVVSKWGAEQSNFTPGSAPVVSGSNMQGHYTQIVNKNVKSMGCGCATCSTASSPNNQQCVCQYDAKQQAGQAPY